MSDLEDFHEVFSHPEAMRYWDCPPYDTIEQTSALLQAMVDAPAGMSDDFVLQHQDRVIGKAGCWCRTHIGFILHPEYWGRGLAHEALVAVLPHIFETLPINKLEADVDPRNAASLKLLTKLGFHEVGRAERTILVGTQWCDSVFLELHRPA